MLRTMVALVAAVTVVATLAAGAWASSDQDALIRLITKYAVDITSGVPAPLKPKVACLCTLSFPTTPGFLVLVEPNQVYCALPTFDADGKFAAASTCSQFQVIAR